MFLLVRRFAALTVLSALALSCQGPSDDPDPTVELPPISDFPRSGSGDGPLNPGAQPSSPATAGGSTAGGTTAGAGGVSDGSFGSATPSLDAGTATGGLDAGRTLDASSPSSASDAAAADAGMIEGGFPDGGIPDAALPDGGVPDTGRDGGCVQIDADAAPCIGSACSVAPLPWRPFHPGACAGWRAP